MDGGCRFDTILLTKRRNASGSSKLPALWHTGFLSIYCNILIRRVTKKCYEEMLCFVFLANCYLGSGFRLRSYHFLQRSSILDLSRRKTSHDASVVNDLQKPYTAVMIVPTGVGASVGGYAGDALPSAKLLSSAVDVLITHPNVMNGAILYWPIDNILYVEGSSLDAFAANKLYLEPLIGSRGQKIGLLLDRGIEKDLMLRHIQVAESMKATLGLDISHIVITSLPAQVSAQVSEYSGASWGSVENIESLVEGARRLKELGCTAIAVVARFPEEDEDDNQDIISDQDHNSSENKPNKTVAEFFGDYRKGEGVDAIAGVEAIISRLISQQVGLPCAHAPAFSPMEVDEEVSPKAAAEEIGYTFLPCVLAYLHRTPNLIPAEIDKVDNSIARRVLRGNDVDAVVVPVRLFSS